MPATLILSHASVIAYPHTTRGHDFVIPVLVCDAVKLCSLGTVVPDAPGVVLGVHAREYEYG